MDGGIFMQRSKYAKYERLMIVKECVDWCKINGNSVAAFAKMKNIKRTSLYNWKNLFSNVVDFENCPTSTSELDALFNNCSKKNQISNFVKIEKLQSLPVKAEVTEEAKQNITIKTQFCSIEIPSDCSKDSIINLLASLKEVQ